MPDLLLAPRDVQFLLYDWLRCEELPHRPRFVEHSRETFDAVLELAQTLAEEHFAPHYQSNDRDEPVFDGERVTLNPAIAPALARLADAGLIGSALDAEVGGMQLPWTIQTACFAWLQAANVSTFAYSFLTMANANLLLAYGSPDQVEQWVRPMLEGRYFGTMCLSETQAGSSLADIRTVARPEADGTYRVSGSKMWISAGDHELGENIIHLVLARTPDGPPGVKGLSLFVVPKWLPSGERNDVVLAGLNHKMGYRGTTNAVLNFGEGVHRPGGSAGAIGYLVGSENAGLGYMFHMMNEARIGVGAGATALGYTGYLRALEYARGRAQGRPAGSKDATRPQVPIIEHADVRRMLLAQKSYVEGALGLILYCARLIDEEGTAPTASEREQAELLLDILTPIAKSWPSQWCLAANDLAIQIHGGYGYTRDYPVEQLYRDNRLNPIHEGTHGIQGQDLLGRKVVMRGGAALQALLARIDATIDAAERTGGEVAALAARLRDAARRIVPTTERLHSQDDPAFVLADASTYLEAVGHVVLGWIWLEQYLATADRQDSFFEGKRQAARYFLVRELPKAMTQFDLLDSLDSLPAGTDPSWF
jgi:butyryl-CoA dehydrogenase